MISLTLHRAALALPPLVIGTNPAESLYLPEDALTWPVFGTRRHYAPESPYEAGRMLLAAVRDATDLPLTVYARGDTTAALEGAKAVLEGAVAQWTYQLDLTVDGSVHTYRGEVLLDVPWGPIDSGEVAAHLARASFSIPLNP